MSSPPNPPVILLLNLVICKMTPDIKQLVHFFFLKGTERFKTAVHFTRNGISIKENHSCGVLDKHQNNAPIMGHSFNIPK